MIDEKIIEEYTIAHSKYVKDIKDYIEYTLDIANCTHYAVTVKANHITNKLMNVFIYIHFLDEEYNKIFGSDITIRYLEKRPVNFENPEMNMEMDFCSKTVFYDDKIQLERCRAIGALATNMSIMKFIIDQLPKDELIAASEKVEKMYRENKEKEMRMHKGIKDD